MMLKLHACHALVLVNCTALLHHCPIFAIRVCCNATVTLSWKACQTSNAVTYKLTSPSSNQAKQSTQGKQSCELSSLCVSGMWKSTVSSAVSMEAHVGWQQAEGTLFLLHDNTWPTKTCLARVCLTSCVRSAACSTAECQEAD